MEKTHLSDAQPAPDMGQLVREYPLHRAWFRRWGNLILACLLLGGAVIYMAANAIQLYQDYFHFGPAIVWKSMRFPLAVEIILLVAGCWAAWKAFSNWKRKVMVYENGLVSSHRSGRQTWRWDQIQCLRYRIVKSYSLDSITGTNQRYILYDSSGKRLVLTGDLEKIEELAGQIREKIYPRLYTQIAREFRAEKPLVFGPVAIRCSKGLTIKKRSYPWNSVEIGGVVQGSVILKLHHDRKREIVKVPGFKIPNLDVFLAILAEMRLPQS